MMLTYPDITLDATSYPIHIGLGCLATPSTWMPIFISGLASQPVFIITDDTVRSHYGFLLEQALKKAGYAPHVLSFPAGEVSKSRQTKQILEDKMLALNGDRHSLILALGGGVVGDLAGFIAATYMRGIPYIQLPTTLLAMVDSSVGGKTAVNTSLGKNTIGAFWPPQSVVMDVDCLATLPLEHLINGLIEAFKMCITCDAASAYHLAEQFHRVLESDKAALMDVIQRAIRIKVDVVNRDPREEGVRALLNFGHTIGHALESVSNYSILHGHAVAYGILVESKIAVLMGFLDKADYQWIKDNLKQLGFIGQQIAKYVRAAIIQATRHDKKNQSNTVRYVLLQQLGAVYDHQPQWTHPVDDKMVQQALIETMQEDE